MKSRSFNLSLLISVLLPLLAAPAAGRGADGDESLPVFKPKVKTVAAFKNGLGFVFKAGEADLKEGWAAMDQLPAAALGTFWIGTTSKAGPVTDVIAFKQKVVEDAAAITHAELLAANVGKPVKLTYSWGNSLTSVEGTLLAVPPHRKPEDPPVDPTAAARGWRPLDEGLRSEIVLLRVQANDRPRVLSINRSLIQAVELADGSNLNSPISKELTRAKVRLGGNPKSAEITMAYLEKGIVWSPSYRLNIENEKTAEITLEAVLANDVEDLEDADVSFVVGYPNFLYADVLSPLGLQQSVASFIQSLMGDRRSDQYGRFGNVMSQAIAYNTANFDASTRPEAAYSAKQPMPGETSEDLFLYRKTGVSLKKGDRARFTIFNAPVPYEHVYLWDLPDSMSVDDRGYRQDAGNRKEPETHVWHVLRIENTTPQPWTTAPAFALNGALPVAQDVLNYTPPGGRSTLKLTVATDLRAEQFQTETARKAVSIEHRSLDEVNVAGKLKLKNWKSKEVQIAVKKSLVGEVLGSDSDGKVTKVARKLTSVNPASEIEWEFRLPGGQEKEINYQYKVLVLR